MNVMTQSRLKLFLACQAMHQYRYIDGYQPINDSTALRFGTAAHAALEVLERGGSVDDALKALISVDPYSDVMLEALITAYAAMWKGDGLEYVAVELPFAVPMGRVGWVNRGKMDAVVRMEGRLYVMEHKTVGGYTDIEDGSPYWAARRMDPQVTVYMRAARMLGYDVHGCIWNVIKKPNIKPYRATPEDKRRFTKAGVLDARQRAADETPQEFGLRIMAKMLDEPHFKREVVVRLPDEMAKFALEIESAADQIDNIKVPIRNTGQCSQFFGRPCDYLGVCEGTESLEDTTKFTKLVDPFPELQEVK